MTGSNTSVLNLPVFFKLIVNNTDIHYLQEEPVGWDKVNIILKRDMTYFGVNYQYTDGDVQLQFYDDCGGDIIKNIFSQTGPDADITFQYGYILDGAELVEFEGSLDLFSLNTSFKGYASCLINTTGFHTLLNSRLDSTVDLFDTKTLDSVLKTNKASIDLKLHSKIIKKQTIVLGPAPAFQNNTDDTNQVKDFYITFPFPDAEDTANQAVTFGGDGFTVDSHNPGMDGVYLATLTDDGKYYFDFDLAFEIHATLDASVGGKAPSFESWTVELIVYHIDKLGALKNQYIIWSDYDNSSKVNGLDYVTKSYHAVCSLYLEDMLMDEKIVFFGHVKIDGKNDWTGMEYWVKTHYPFPDQIPILTITALTIAPDTNSKAFMVHEAIENVVESVTGNASCVKSDYFGRTDIGYPKTGDGGNYAINNGFLIRNFINTDGTPKRQLTISFKELLSSLHSIFGIGIGYEYDNGGNQYLRIEPADYYFQANEIFLITDCSDYATSVAKEFIYNIITVGYKKYPEPSYSGDETSKAGVDLLDEFLTQLEFSTPVRKNSQKIELLSELIASGFAIEETRRAQFSSDKNNSTTYDDDNFIISIKNDAGTWKSETGTDVLALPIKDSYQNCISPETTYNFRISPKRNLLRWSNWLNGSLFYYKNAKDHLKNTSYKMNGFLATKLIGETQFIKEKDDVSLNDLNNRNLFFYPVWITFKCRMTIDEIRIVKDAYTGRNETLKNGYISVMNDLNEKVSGWLYEMSYSPVSEQVTFKLLGTALSGNNGCDCNAYADWTSLDFKTNVYPQSIKDCLFAAFHHSN